LLPAPLEPIARDLAQSAIVVDFDGTIAPIVADPRAARPLAGARTALQQLVTLARSVTVISARPVAFLVDAVDVAGVHIVGQYGAERLVGDAPMVDERFLAFITPLQDAADEADAALPGLLVERKGLGVTLHWRLEPDREAEAVAVGRILAERYGLTLAPGRMALELRPPVPIDKGVAVEVEVAGAAAALCAGDDRSDLHMFDALDRMTRDGRLHYAARVAVESLEGPAELVARGDVVVAGPAGVADLLLSLVEGR
jgi:trehalose 6-phosphate phosphatase